MKALVTGGTGFIGRHLVEALLDRGIGVRMLSRTRNREERFERDGLQLVTGDIAQAETLRGVCRGVDAVFHLAAQVGVWGLPWERYAEVNIRGTGNLLDAALDAGVTRFIFASTPGVQGKGHARATEDLPYHPPYAYERSKCEAEKIVLRYGREKGLPVTVIRPDFVYGPGDTRRLGLYRAIQKRRFFIIGRGESVLHPTYVADAVQGFMLAMGSPVAPGEIYNIAGPHQVSVNVYVDTICRSLNAVPPGIRIPKAAATAMAVAWEAVSRVSGREPLISRSRIEFLTQDHGSDITKARRQLGYEPRIGFPEGVALTVAWCRSHSLLA